MTNAREEWDDLVVGAGMAGLTVAAMLAAEGRRVLVLEAHDVPGGYAHTFQIGAWRFCAQVHYIFGCGEGEAIHRLLSRIGLADEVRFHRLDPEGFDHVVVAGERVRVCNGLEKYRDRLARRWPQHEGPLRSYFDAIMAIGREVDALPQHVRVRDVLTAPLRFPHLLRWRTWTLQRLFDHVGMPPRLQAFLAGQSGDYLLPPERVSLLLHVALVRAYDRGAYYPEKHFKHFIDGVAGSIASRPGCAVRYGAEVARVLTERGRAVGVQTRGGETLRARRVISNVDPRRTAELVGRDALPARWLRRLDYAYSTSSLTLYLGVRGLDLRAHGFGAWNVWHWPSEDMNATYRRQERGELDDPWLFISTPTLHTDAPGPCPPGHQILELVTGAPYARFAELRARDRVAYNREKKRLRERMIATVEERFVPNLSRHVALRVMGTPATNARFCFAPEGNAYGAELTPENIRWSRVPAETPVEGLYMVGATAGYPSIGATVAAGLALAERLRAR